MNFLEPPSPKVHRVAARTVSFETLYKRMEQRAAPAQILPRDAREILINASQYLPRSSRVTAVNTAITRVRAMYPQYFKKEI